MQDPPDSLTSAPVGSRSYYRQRLALAQRRQKELEEQIANVRKSQVAHASAQLLDVWRAEIEHWKNVEQAANQELQDVG